MVAHMASPHRIASHQIHHTMAKPNTKASPPMMTPAGEFLGISMSW